MLLKTLYMSRGTDHSLWRPPCERDEEREPSRWLAPIGRENWGDFVGFGSSGRRR